MGRAGAGRGVTKERLILAFVVDPAEVKAFLVAAGLTRLILLEPFLYPAPKG